MLARRGRYGQQCTNTYLLSALEGIVGGDRNSQQVLVRIDEEVRNGHDGRVVQHEGDGRDGLDTAQEKVHENILVNIKNVGAEDVARVEDLNDRHAEREGRNVQHVEQRRF